MASRHLYMNASLSMSQQHSKQQQEQQQQQQQQQQQPTCAAAARVSDTHATVALTAGGQMDMLYARLACHTFADHASALEYCSRIAAGFGYSVHQHDEQTAHAARTDGGLCWTRARIRVAGEGREMQLCLQTSSDDNGRQQWVFCKDSSSAWPAEVQDAMVQLVQQRVPADAIRQTLQQQFPSLQHSWDEGVFSRQLDAERARGVRERSQRLLVLSARLCAVVAANEEWTRAVEHNMARMVGAYRPSATPEALDSLATLGTVRSAPADTSSKKKQRGDPQHKGMQLVQVPECTLTIQPTTPLFAPPQHQAQHAAAAAAAVAASYGGLIHTPAPLAMPFGPFDDAIMAGERPSGSPPFFYPPASPDGDLLHH